MAEAERQPLISGDNSGSNEGKSSFEVRYEEARRQTRRFLGSKNGHYAVILMVAADVGGIFASFVLEHYLCTHECCQAKTQYRAWHEAEEALGIVSLVFSCLFMAELTASVWAFGLPYGPAFYTTSRNTSLISLGTLTTGSTGWTPSSSSPASSST